MAARNAIRTEDMADTGVESRRDEPRRPGADASANRDAEADQRGHAAQDEENDAVRSCAKRIRMVAVKLSSGDVRNETDSEGQQLEDSE
jgi:hypothetical protein